MGLKKTQIFAQNPLGLAYGFSENGQFGAKTDRNLVFLGCDAQITNRLYITVPYMSFGRFWKKIKILLEICTG
jgi:hypothetical protein